MHSHTPSSPSPHFLQEDHLWSTTAGISAADPSTKHTGFYTRPCVVLISLATLTNTYVHFVIVFFSSVGGPSMEYHCRYLLHGSLHWGTWFLNASA